uniref:YCII-related domain-containing protein n=1 Tax=Odontella aurita TaxID=265563 RepID=A0A7S4HJ48_9STRA|mmetsp:Transcript_10791/g.31956  ORF Transcript_10791/g.31956 Transcript_10791/m.31956 type:complete len:136 (+) Transcript_10791:221-628(+)|eukprot:CAMPEP_0113530270 /NCGR_PEP_ID=MMETSP0015_2-20120614/2845_1 /TAXON_ID=2838 /ORGANISM="Odontella" /LENGTH=135 /DNA_ID=CAMNT_0000428971 /DNA_START=160 /DNA_END=567 /DNA_ORIENTATION=+ /assembly_acc=CAM_ASM_000160
MSPVSLARTSVLAFLGSQRQVAGPTISRSQRAFTSTPALSATNYLLNYDYVPDVLEKRAPHREGHIGLAKKLIDEGKCLSGGPTGPPSMDVPTGALFIFTELAAAEYFVAKDPYVEHGIVTDHSIQEWNVVVQKE